jgi:hypothetical protein
MTERLEDFAGDAGPVRALRAYQDLDLHADIADAAGHYSAMAITPMRSKTPSRR